MPLIGGLLRRREAHRFWDRGTKYWESYRRGGASPDDLDAAIQHFQKALEFTSLGHSERHLRLLCVAVAYWNRWSLTRNSDDLDTTIKQFEESIHLTPPNSPELVKRIDLLIGVYLDKHRYTKVSGDIELAISWCQKALELLPQNHADRAESMYRLGKAYHTKYEHSNDIKDLSVSIHQLLEVRSLTPANHPDHADRLQTLANGYRQRYGCTKAPVDLEMIIKLHQEVVDVTPDDHPYRFARLNALAIDYRARHLSNGTLDDIQTALLYFQKAVDCTPSTHSDRPALLTNLSIAYEERYEFTRTANDLGLAVQYLQEALALPPRDNYVRQGLRLISLHKRYYKRYTSTKMFDDLETGLNLARQAVHLLSQEQSRGVVQLQDGNIVSQFKETLVKAQDVVNKYTNTFEGDLINPVPQDHPERARIFEDRGKAHSSSYAYYSGDWIDITLAIKYCQDALDLTSQDHPDRPSRLLSLATAYHCRHDRNGVLADLEKTIELLHEALPIIPYHHTRRPEILEMLGIAYCEMYKFTHNETHLSDAMSYCQVALELTPQDHSDRADRLSSLASCHNYSYLQHDHSGALAHLDLAIQYTKEALELTSDSMARASEIENLAICYENRYSETGAMNDLEEAIRRMQESLNLTPSDNTKRARRIELLGSKYQLRYARTGVLDDLEQAIRKFQEALDLTPTDHPVRADRLISLSHGQMARYSWNRALNDLDESIQQIQEALSLMPPNHLTRSDRLAMLGEALKRRYLKTKDPIDLDEAIRHAKEASDLSVKLFGNPYRARRYGMLASVFYIKYYRDLVLDDMKMAMAYSKQGLMDENSRPLDRLSTSWILLSLHGNNQNWIEAYEAAEVVLSLIPLITLRYLEHSDTQHLATKVTDIASNAATFALNAGKPIYKAISLLEVGRGLVASPVSDIRMDTIDLNERHPEFAAQFHSLRNLLDTPKESRKNSQRYDLGNQLQKLIQDIRRLPRFDRFLLGPSEDDIKAAATCDPIVIINVSKYGCHALIIKQKEIRSLDLPLLHIEDIRARAHAVNLVDIDVELLEWLWITIAAPVLDTIGFNQTPQDTWPRVWWICTGPLARFPIHAAGRYTAGVCDTVLDRVVSSYSSSLRALIDARQKSLVPNIEVAQSSMILIGMAQTPGYSSLLHVDEEVEAVSKIGRSMKLEVKQPKTLLKEEVLSTINDGCKIFHFAGHGYTDQADPSQSALILSNSRLTVENLFETNLSSQKPFLAYLSACGTGQVKHEKLMDEGLHLIGACQLAGFQHVIGTLWEVNDELCIGIAKDTYEWIKEKDMSHMSVSEGLHHAMRAARSRWIKENATRRDILKSRRVLSVESTLSHVRDITFVEDLPMNWVPFVHFGI